VIYGWKKINVDEKNNYKKIYIKSEKERP